MAGAQVPPPARAHHALVYDAQHERVLLPGGSTPLDGGSRFEFFNDLWAFDGTRWTALAPSGSKRSGQRLVRDSRRNIIVSFGGYSGESLGDLLRHEDGRWVTVSSLPDRPTAEGGFVYDADCDRFVLYGGSGAPRQSWEDTREFDGSRWITAATIGPGPRQSFAMVYDTKRKRTVLFGGGGTGPSLRNTSPRAMGYMAYDERRDRVVLVGGRTGWPDGDRNDTWEWDGARWTRVATRG